MRRALAARLCRCARGAGCTTLLKALCRRLHALDFGQDHVRGFPKVTGGVLRPTVERVESGQVMKLVGDAPEDGDALRECWLHTFVEFVG